MTLSQHINALGRQRSWAAIQFTCVIISAVLDPLLIPWFQRTQGNGALGLAWATVASEILMLAGGLWLAGPGLLDRALLSRLGRCALAGAAMAAAAIALRSLNPWIAAPVSLAAYGGAAHLLGIFGASDLAQFRNALRRGKP